MYKVFLLKLRLPYLRLRASRRSPDNRPSGSRLAGVLSKGGAILRGDVGGLVRPPNSQRLEISIRRDLVCENAAGNRHRDFLKPRWCVICRKSLGHGVGARTGSVKLHLGQAWADDEVSRASFRQNISNLRLVSRTEYRLAIDNAIRISMVRGADNAVMVTEQELRAKVDRCGNNGNGFLSRADRQRGRSEIAFFFR